MRSWTGLLAVPVLALAVGGSPGARPDASGPGGVERGRWVEGPVCVTADTMPRAQDGRVTAALIQEAATMSSADKFELLTAIAENPTISADNELRLIEAAKTMSSASRKELLVVLARTVRVDVQEKR